MTQQPPRKRLPPKPEPPDPAECCGSGCEPCILELYDDELERWEERVQHLRAAAARGEIMLLDE